MNHHQAHTRAARPGLTVPACGLALGADSAVAVVNALNEVAA